MAHASIPASSATTAGVVSFRSLPDLACANVGGKALQCSDDFFGQSGLTVAATATRTATAMQSARCDGHKSGQLMRSRMAVVAVFLSFFISPLCAAEMSNLLRPEAPVFHVGKFTENGKW